MPVGGRSPSCYALLVMCAVSISKNLHQSATLLSTISKDDSTITTNEILFNVTDRVHNTTLNFVAGGSAIEHVVVAPRLSTTQNKPKPKAKGKLHPNNNKADAKKKHPKEKDRWQQLNQIFPGLARLDQTPAPNDKLVYRPYPSSPPATTRNEISGFVQGCDQNSPRNVQEIQLHVIGWKRTLRIQSLLETLQTADYSGWTQGIPLYIHTDGGADPELLQLVQEFTWNHGPKYLDPRTENIGLRNMWLTSMGAAAKQADDNTLMVVFEDDIRVSPVYFQWLLSMIDRYARNPECRDSDLVGFSLSPIVFQELYNPFYPFDPEKELQGRYLPQGQRHAAYLTSVPSSWGAAYWSDHWKRFDAFVTARMKLPFYNLHAENVKDGMPVNASLITPDYLHIPNAVTNRWAKSWKRFMVDFMYAQGTLMLYPNFPRQQALANSRQDDGEHGGKITMGKRNYYYAELVETNDWIQWQQGQMLKDQHPPYRDLMVFGLDHKVRTKELVMARGMDFLNNVSASCTDIRCAALLKLWSRPGWKVPNRDNSKGGYPLVCVADAYMSVAGAARHPARATTMHDDDRRYLVFDPSTVSTHDTTEKRRTAVMQAFWWAKVLGRTFVLPRSVKFDNWQSFLSKYSSESQPGKPTFTVDNAGLRDVISFEEFSSNTDKPWRKILLNAASSPQTSETDVAMVVDLRHIFGGQSSIQLDTIQHLFGGCNDKVLAFQ